MLRFRTDLTLGKILSEDDNNDSKHLYIYLLCARHVPSALHILILY